jgi:streptogramin lyase
MVEDLESRWLLAVNLREFPIPTAGSNPFWITSGPGSSLYFTAGGTNQIGQFDPGTHDFTNFPIPAANLGPRYITTAPDGNLDFTASNANEIVQLNPASHVFTNFPIPTTDTSAGFITTGPDGNLYFIEPGLNSIGQLNPVTHVFRTFQIPTANSGATGMTSGPDNTLWFTETTANKIGQLNPVTHVFREFPIPAASSGAAMITTGPDGNLYFTEPGINSIGQLNPVTHVFRSFPIPTTDSGPSSITSGSDGNIYFVESAANKIGQFNPNRLRFKELTIPTASSGATGITAGPDGNVYFTETSGNKIGQVLITTLVATTTHLTVAPNPALVGQVVTLTATVTATGTKTPTGTVTFFIDGTAQPPVKLAQRNGLAQATLSKSKLPDVTHVITATYKGNATFASSVSNAVSLVVAPAPGDGPVVVSLVRLGFHAEPTTLVLTFDKALDPVRAQEVSNYRIVKLPGPSIRVASVRYDPSDFTVTLSPAKRLSLHHPYRLTVVGTAPSGLTDTSGNLLDGAYTGHPGSNFVAIVNGKRLARPGKEKARAGVLGFSRD